MIKPFRTQQRDTSRKLARVIFNPNPVDKSKPMLSDYDLYEGVPFAEQMAGRRFTHDQKHYQPGHYSAIGFSEACVIQVQLHDRLYRMFPSIELMLDDVLCGFIGIIPNQKFAQKMEDAVNDFLTKVLGLNQSLAEEGIDDDSQPIMRF